MTSLNGLHKSSFLQYGTLYFALARIWNLPFPEEIVGTITAIDTFLGCMLGISTLNYEERKEKELQEAKDLNAQNQ